MYVNNSYYSKRKDKRKRKGVFDLPLWCHCHFATYDGCSIGYQSHPREAPHDLDAKHTVGEVGTIEDEFEVEGGVGVHGYYRPLGRGSMIQDISVEHWFYRRLKFH